LLLRRAAVPAEGGVVVVRPGVDHAVRLVVVWQVGIGGAAGERELQDLHARQAEAVAQLFDVGGDHAQVLGDDGQPGALVGSASLGGALVGGAQRLAQLAARRRDPAPLHRGRLAYRDLPVGGETAEVV